MSRQVRAFAALAEDLSSGPNTHTDSSQSSSREPNAFFWAQRALNAHGA